MKTILIKILGAALLCALVTSPLPAQTYPLTNSEATAILSAKDTVELEKKKLETDLELAERKLEIEKNIVSTREDVRKMMVHDVAWNSWVLAVLGSILMCGIFRNQRNKMTQETVRLMIEKGTPITPELVTALKSKDRVRTGIDPHGHLAWGLILVAVGIGLLIMAVKAGWIVLLIGGAFLLLWGAGRIGSKDGQSK